jgi:DNA polymerase III epsilon subunit-like protein
MPPETYISVDVETAGPIPAQYPMLSIGACLIENLSTTFYMELQPDRAAFVPEALAVSGLDLEALRLNGNPPQAVMQAFADWVKQVVPQGSRAVFVALNAPFDWMFVNDYFQRYLGHNPFGHSALDIKAFYMGTTGVAWSETSWKHIAAHLKLNQALAHNALRDAQDQGAIFREIQHLAINQ